VVPTLVLVASLAAGAAPLDVALPPPALAPRRALHQEDDPDDDRDRDDDDHRHRRHLLLSGWGGEAFARGGTGRASSFWGGEVAWAFSELDVGLEAAWYRALRDANRTWTPVLMTRVTQRFMTGRGIEAAFSIGFGAGKPSHWIGWYQVAIGGRVPVGPLFVGAELAFEQYDIIRLGGGLGVAF
jgi:hypothetical protein